MRRAHHAMQHKDIFLSDVAHTHCCTIEVRNELRVGRLAASHHRHVIQATLVLVYTSEQRRDWHVLLQQNNFIITVTLGHLR